MKTRLTMRVALALGLPGAARVAGRYRRLAREVLASAGHEAGRGNIISAAGFLVLWVVGF
ncbi:hypothetical protein [Methylobacterium platani]|uniref:hypothetical protein n=1 Tax=Methylobacterium platani TaxID=427683 RepID=UPI0007DBF34D|nr:hypothetical protein [Methylobacterium platani]